jgi:ABC-type antimicrobial peptide transport system permease subunit
LKSKYSDFKAVAMCDGGGRHSLQNGDKNVMKNGFFIGEDAVGMFSLNILYGSKNPLHDPYSIVLTDETAAILFNTTNVVGKIIKLDNAHSLTVTAVVAKQPKNSSLVFDYLLPWQLQESIYPDAKNYKSDWGNNSWQTFVQLNNNVNAESVNAKIKDVVLNHFAHDKIKQASKMQLELFPISKWKLYTDFENGKIVGGYIKYVRLFGILGLVVLLIACINFMNLSTARSSKRAKEIGIRKVVGSLRKQLIGQFLSESMLVTGIAFLLSLVIVLITLPYFNQLTDKDMSLFIANPVFWSLTIAFTLLTGLIAGSYPALYLSSFNPIKILKGKISTGKGSALPRKILVVVQFTSSVVLMIGTIIIYQQIQHGKDRPIGYDKNGLITVNYSSDMNKSFAALQNDLLASGAIYAVCKSNSSATENQCNQNGWEWKGSKPTDKSIGINTIATEYNYTKTMGIKLIAGRDFSIDYSTDSFAVMLNQAAVKLMQLKNPVGETIRWNGQNRVIVGVIPDLQMESPFQSASPMIIKFSTDWINALIVRINPNVSMSKAINTIKPIFEKYDAQFDYQFADEAYAKKFNYEELVANLASVITIIAIFISCLGLFGLASYMAEQRTKEIGVRRVLGASVSYIWQMLSRDFVGLVLIASTIAIPIAWYLMNKWLSSYEYKINIGFGVFALVITASIVIALLTVSFQAIKAAIANPVKSLKTE